MFNGFHNERLNPSEMSLLRHKFSNDDQEFLELPFQLLFKILSLKAFPEALTVLYSIETQPSCKPSKRICKSCLSLISDWGRLETLEEVQVATYVLSLFAHWFDADNAPVEEIFHKILFYLLSNPLHLDRLLLSRVQKICQRDGLVEVCIKSFGWIQPTIQLVRRSFEVLNGSFSVSVTDLSKCVKSEGDMPLFLELVALLRSFCKCDQWLDSLLSAHDLLLAFHYPMECTKAFVKIISDAIAAHYAVKETTWFWENLTSNVARYLSKNKKNEIIFNQGLSEIIQILAEIQGPHHISLQGLFVQLQDSCLTLAATDVNLYRAVLTFSFKLKPLQFEGSKSLWSTVKLLCCSDDKISYFETFFIFWDNLGLADRARLFEPFLFNAIDPKKNLFMDIGSAFLRSLIALLQNGYHLADNDGLVLIASLCKSIGVATGLVRTFIDSNYHILVDCLALALLHLVQDGKRNWSMVMSDYCPWAKWILYSPHLEAHALPGRLYQRWKSLNVDLKYFQNHISAAELESVCHMDSDCQVNVILDHIYRNCKDPEVIANLTLPFVQSLSLFLHLSSCDPARLESITAICSRLPCEVSISDSHITTLMKRLIELPLLRLQSILNVASLIHANCNTFMIDLFDLLLVKWVSNREIDAASAGVAMECHLGCVFWLIERITAVGITKSEQSWSIPLSKAIAHLIKLCPVSQLVDYTNRIISVFKYEGQHPSPNSAAAQFSGMILLDIFYYFGQLRDHASLRLLKDLNWTQVGDILDRSLENILDMQTVGSACDLILHLLSRLVSESSNKDDADGYDFSFMMDEDFSAIYDNERTQKTIWQSKFKIFYNYPKQRSPVDSLLLYFAILKVTMNHFADDDQIFEQYFYSILNIIMGLDDGIRQKAHDYLVLLNMKSFSHFIMAPMEFLG